MARHQRVAPLALGTPEWATLRGGSRAATVTWIGHSTVLLQLDGVTFLTDPNWGNCSGPFSGLIGVRRCAPPGIALDDLPH